MNPARVEKQARALVAELCELRKTNHDAADTIAREIRQALTTLPMAPPDQVGPAVAKMFATYKEH